MNKSKTFFIFLAIAALLGIVIISVFRKAETENNSAATKNDNAANTENNVENSAPQSEKESQSQLPIQLQPEPVFVAPLDNTLTRVTKKPFGIYVSPQNSPVTPEKFRGYHTGVDFETFSEEQNTDVSVAAICEGKILEKRRANGYGGVVVQFCSLDNNPITVIYGHIRLSSMKNSESDVLKAGDFLGFLGTGYSAETDGERKHLHLGIHRGKTIDIRGYAGVQSELKNWIDIGQYLK
jgi:hypothetical protein